MDGFGLPAQAGRFRFRAESKIVERMIREAIPGGVVLDLGSGVGYWAEFFARRFAKVIAVENSRPLFEALVERCSAFHSVVPIHSDVKSFEPEHVYELVFLGGMLMYLNEEDVVSLLRRLAPRLAPGAKLLCRETTVRRGEVTRQGTYQAVYRSVSTYTKLFEECGLSVEHVESNVPYVVIQMSCELINKWKRLVPEALQIIPAVGHAAYWGVRIGHPWVTRVSGTLGIAFPELTNHFLVLSNTKGSETVSRCDRLSPRTSEVPSCGHRFWTNKT